MNQKVVRAEVATGPDGRSRGYGVAAFAAPGGAAAAIEHLNDKELNGRLVFVRADRMAQSGGNGCSGVGGSGVGGSGGGGSGGGGSGGGGGGGGTHAELPGGRRVFVGNLPWDASWHDLKDHFRQAGEVCFIALKLRR